MTKRRSVPARYLLRLLEVVKDNNIDPEKFIKNQEFSYAQLSDSKHRINYENYLSVLIDVVNNTDISALGLKTGQKIALADHGILGYAFISSDNLRKAFEIFSLYQEIQGPIVNVSMLTEGNEVVYSTSKARPLDARLYRHVIASWLGESSNIRSLYDPGHLEFNSARVTFPEPSDAQVYRDLLGCEVEFSQAVNELRFSSKFLDEPFSLAEESVAQLCADQCEKMLNEMSSTDDIVDDVRRTLLNKPGELHSLEKVAKSLCVSARTLRRRLRDANTSFRVVQSEIRMGLAVEYLTHSNLPIAEIAYLLLYSDVTAFHRSFKQHFKITPAQYRKQESL